MIKRIGLAFLGIALLASPLLAGALTQDEIQRQIDQLLQQVRELQEQISRAQQGQNPAEAHPACPNLSRSLWRGLSGEDVRELQTFLISQGLLEQDSATGYFGRLTEAAVKRFQAEQGIEQTGIVGPLTRAAIARVCSGATATIPAPTCIVATNTQTPQINQPFTLSWGSTNADFMAGLQGADRWAASGSQSLTESTAGTKTYALSFVGAGGLTICATAVTVTATPTSNASCTFNNQTVAHGASVAAYQSSTVPYGNQCVSETRTCNNGTLSGSYLYASCTPVAPASCTWNGQTIAHGASVTAYQSAAVASGSQCVSEQRSCTNGSLSGSYAYATCAVAPVSSGAVGTGSATDKYLTVSPTSGAAPLTVTAKVSLYTQSSNMNGPWWCLAYTVSWGDGTTTDSPAGSCGATGSTPPATATHAHTYASTGTYIVAYTVSGFGGQGSVTVTATSGGAAPLTVTAGASSSGGGGMCTAASGSSCQGAYGSYASGSTVDGQVITGGPYTGSVVWPQYTCTNGFWMCTKYCFGGVDPAKRYTYQSGSPQCTESMPVNCGDNYTGQGWLKACTI